MEKMLNERIVTLKLTRIDVCDLLLACTALDTATDSDNHKWEQLHDKLNGILDEFDKKQGY